MLESLLLAVATLLELVLRVPAMLSVVLLPLALGRPLPFIHVVHLLLPAGEGILVLAARVLSEALAPPHELLRLPFEIFVGVLEVT